MTPTIFIVSYRKHFEYLRYCLRSIAKFASGFDTVLVVPGTDFEDAVKLVRENSPSAAVRCGDEWNGKGMLWAMTQKCRADEWCPNGDPIFHIDSDCVWTEPVTPADYMLDGKPLLLYESFVSMNRKGITECDKWQVCTQRCLPFDVLYETMRRHPEVYHRDLYPRTRQLVEQKTGMKFDEYVMSGHNSFPQAFCEFNTLGNVALQCFADRYALYNLEHKPWPPNKLRQAWSHREPTAEDVTRFKELGLA